MHSTQALVSPTPPPSLFGAAARAVAEALQPRTARHPPTASPPLPIPCGPSPGATDGQRRHGCGV
eukprot:3341360-Pleurochrysis_carterae.AAC.1